MKTSHGHYLTYLEGCECKPCAGAFKTWTRLKNDSGKYNTGYGKFHTGGYGPPARHGTRSMYNNGCRCEFCTKSSRDYMAAIRRRKALQGST